MVNFDSFYFNSNTIGGISVKIIKVLLILAVLASFLLVPNLANAQFEQEDLPDWAIQVGFSVVKNKLLLAIDGDTLGVNLEPATKVIFSDGKIPEEKKVLIEEVGYKSILLFNLKNWTVEILNKPEGTEKFGYNKFRIESFSARIRNLIDDKRIIGGDSAFQVSIQEDPEKIILSIEKEQWVIKKKNYPQLCFELVDKKFLVVTDHKRKLLYSDDGIFGSVRGRYQFGVFFRSQYAKDGWDGMLFAQGCARTLGRGVDDSIDNCLQDLIKAAWENDIRNSPSNFFLVKDKTLWGKGPTLDGWYEIESWSRGSSLWINPKKWVETVGYSAIKFGSGWRLADIKAISKEGILSVQEDKRRWEVTFLWGDPKSGYSAKEVTE